MPRKSSKGKRSRNPRNRRGQSFRLMHPSQLRTNVVVKHRFRFTSTSATARTITDTNLLGIGGAVCSVANTTLNMINSTTKLHSVEVWAPPASQGAASTCSVEWVGQNFAPNIEVSDTSNSVAEPAHVRAKPPPGSQASLWLPPVGNQIMIVIAPIGSIIDLVCSHTMQDDGIAGTAATVATGSLGAMYFMYLDGATHTYVPTSLTSTF